MPALSANQKKVLFLSSLGGVLEYYDFVIYLFLAPFIEKIFFAGNSSYLATLKTLAIFAAGYLVRPLGGVIFSHFGDRYGRKVVFLMTVVFMAVPSFAIGFLPPTAEIGMLAPILLLLFRLMQGLALGGEIPASITFVSEHVPRERLGFALATLFFGINIGLLLGSLITTLITNHFDNTAILAYAWRYPFMLAGIFGLLAIYLRRYLRETAAFTKLRKQDLVPVPIVTLLQHHYLQVIQGFFLAALGAVTIFYYLYWPQYLHQYYDYNLADIMRINTISIVVLNVVIIAGGILGDKIGHRRLYMFGAMMLLLLTYPLSFIMTLHHLKMVLMSYLMFSLIVGLIPSVYCAMLSNLFPTPVRYSGVALSYNMAYAIFGGMGPVICTVLIHEFQSALAPAYYMMVTAMLALIASYVGRNVKSYPASDRVQLLSAEHGS